MNWRAIFGDHKIPEKEKQDEQAAGSDEQVSQFSLFLVDKEAKKRGGVYKTIWF